MADGDTVISSMATDWKHFISDDLEKELAELAESIADRLQQTNESRARLIEQTREFKRNSSEEVRVAVAPVLRGFQTEVDAAARRTKAADGALLTVYKKLVHMPAMLQTQQMSVAVQKLESEHQFFKTALEQQEADAMQRDMIIKELKDKLVEHDAKVSALIQSKVRDKELELEAKFDVRLKHLLSVQQTLLETVKTLEKRTVVMQIALSSCTSELADLKSRINVGNFNRSLTCDKSQKPTLGTEDILYAPVAESEPLDFRVDSMQSALYGATPLPAAFLPASADSSASQSHQVTPLCLTSRQLQAPSLPSSSIERNTVKTEDTDVESSDAEALCKESAGVIDTAEVANCVRQLLLVRNIGQRQFARNILGLTQGTVSELLAKPKPWERLTEKGKDSYRRMFNWMVDQVDSSTWLSRKRQSDPINAVSSSVSTSGHHQHDTEQRVAQILNEAKAAMKADRSETRVADNADDDTASPDGSVERVVNGSMPSDSGSRTPVETIGLDSSPAPTTIEEGNPRDVVARIYREELLKLTEMAQASGNMAEFAMYENELERLSKRSNVVDSPVVKVTSRLRGDKSSHRAGSKKVNRKPVRVANEVFVDVDKPEDLTTSYHANRVSPVNSYSVLDLSNDTSDVNRSASNNPSCAVKELLQVGCNSTPVICSERVKLEIQELETEDSKSGMDCNQSPLDLMQTITDSVVNKSNKKCAGLSTALEPSRVSLPPITSEQLKRCSNLDTEDIVVAVRTTLADYSISQRLFGEAVLGLSQGSVSDLLARPKPWPLLTSKGREPFIRMRMFLDDPEGAVRRLVATQYKVPADKLLRSSDTAEAEVVLEVRKRKNSVDSSSNDGTSTQSKKQPRVNFTPEQKDALRRAYNADPYPTQLSIDRLAAELGIGPRTVVNWFHNHRMRYAKQQYAATGIWSVTGVNQKHDMSDQELDQSSLNGYDHDSTTDAGSSTDQTRDEFDLSLVCGIENSSEECISDSGNLNSHSLSAGCGSNRRKSARPQRLGAAGEGEMRKSATDCDAKTPHDQVT